jgi:hypothetical protein
MSMDEEFRNLCEAIVVAKRRDLTAKGALKAALAESEQTARELSDSRKALDEWVWRQAGEFGAGRFDINELMDV